MRFGSLRICAVGTISSARTIFMSDAFNPSASDASASSICTLPSSSTLCTCIMPKSGFTEGTSATTSPVNGHSTAVIFCESFLKLDFFSMSLPSMLFTGMKGSPSAPPYSRIVMERFV